MRSSQHGACRLEPEKRNISSGVEHDADTRDVDAGLWLCTDASEPQFSSFIFVQKKTHPFNIPLTKKCRMSCLSWPEVPMFASIEHVFDKPYFARK